MKSEGATSGDQMLSVGLSWGLWVLTSAAAAVFLTVAVRSFRQKLRIRMAAFFSTETASAVTEISDD